MEKWHARGLILGLVLALAPCVQPGATAAVPPLATEGLTASFDESGVLLEPTRLPGGWSWRYTLTSFGRAGLQLPAPPPVLAADAGKRELVRPGLREAYEVKDTVKGFEQSFVIEQPPAGKGSILIEGRVTTNLAPEGGIRLPNRVAYLLDGLPQIQYANLAVYDATGRPLAARMDWTEDGQTISLWIDEEGQYPITVDPGIGGCSCGNQTHCWCTAVALCSGTDCVDPMHAALSPLKIDGSVGGATFFYRTLEGQTSSYDHGKMILLEMGITGTAASADMQYPIGTNQRLACSGHSFLRDGRLFIAGGSFQQGLADDAYIWRDLALQATSNDNKMCGEQMDFASPTLCDAPTPSGLAGSRWYPTTIPLWNGRIMVIGGAAEQDLSTSNNSYEFYEPPTDGSLGVFTCNPAYLVKDSAGNNLCEFSPTCKVCWDYPRYHAIPEGLFLAGTLHRTRLFQYSKLESNQLWATDPNQPYLHMEPTSRGSSASVMLEVNLEQPTDNQTSRVLLVGGYGDAGPPIRHLDTAELFDAQALAWRWTGCDPGQSGECKQTMQKVRLYPKTVLLPNNTVLIVGGEGNAIDGGDQHPGENSSEIFDPSTQMFTSLLESEEGLDRDRRYHAQAFLLPDGRVITAGDDYYDGEDHEEGDQGIIGDVDGATYNVYYPTYMSPASARPTILTSPAPPATITWGGSFNVCVSGINDDFHSVILVRPSSTTHLVDFDHRQVQVQATDTGEVCGSGGKTIEVTLPAYPTDWRKHVLPPGYYMLIVRKETGGLLIPSGAKFVELLCPTGVCVDE